MNLREFAKTAINLQTARRAVGTAVKPLLIRRGMRYADLLHPSISRGLDARMLSSKVGPFTEHPRITKMFKREGVPVKDFGKKPAILASGSVDKIPVAREAGGALKGRQSEMVNRLMLLHEHSEVKNARKIKNLNFQRTGGHTDPKVLLDEHNAVATLPKRYARARKFMQGLRSAGPEGLQFNMAGLEYGKHRLSPAAKKFFAKKLRGEAR